MELPISYAAEESENSMLAKMLMEQNVLAVWVDSLTEDHFRDVTNREIFVQVRETYKKHAQADLTCLENASEDALLKGMEILANAQTSAKTEYYFSKLEHARKIRSAAMEIASWTDYESEESVDDLTGKLTAITSAVKEFPEYTMKQLTERAMDRWERKIKTRKSYHLGIPCIDDHLRIKAGNMVYIVAPPKTGKTWLEVSIANFLSTGNKVYMVSAEMHPDDIYTRIASKVAKTDLTPLDYLDDIHRGKLESWGKVAGELITRNLMIVKARGMNFGTLKGKLMSAIQRGYDVILIDYLQRIKGTGPDQRIITMEMSRDLTDMAGRYEKLFIVASQASRAAKHSEITRAHHAKESGAIEEDADVVLSLTSKDDHKIGENHNLAVEVCQRNGFTGIAYLEFDPRTGTYQKGEEWK